MTTAPSRRALFRSLGTGFSDAKTGKDSVTIAVISESCLEYKGVSCRRCGEMCDVSAIRFKPALGGRSLITLDAQRCTGCGDCLPVCPASAISLIAKPSDEATV